ncbi:MAG TPA: hypothetical protein VEI97_04980 [bacterium]|nr:hypothetical protein [bacterium]
MANGLDTSRRRLRRVLRVAFPGERIATGYTIEGRPLDAFFPRARVAVVVDGSATHGDRRDLDRWRALVERHGLAAVVVDPEELRRRPRQMIRRLRFVLNLRTRWRAVFDPSPVAS